MSQRTQWWVRTGTKEYDECLRQHPHPQRPPHGGSTAWWSRPPPSATSSAKRAASSIAAMRSASSPARPPTRRSASCSGRATCRTPLSLTTHARCAHSVSLPDAAKATLRALPPPADPMDVVAHGGLGDWRGAADQRDADLRAGGRADRALPDDRAVRPPAQRQRAYRARADLGHAANYLYMLTGEDA